MRTFSGSNALAALAIAKTNEEAATIANAAESLREEVTRGVIGSHRKKVDAGVEDAPDDYTTAYNDEVDATIKMVQEFRAKKARREEKAKLKRHGVMDATSSEVAIMDQIDKVFQTA